MPRVNARIDRELDLTIQAYARANGLTRSQAIRELLRQAGGTAKPVTRGWLEGFNKGYAEARASFEDRARKPVPPT